MSATKYILVTGDWIADWNLALPANLPEGYFDGTTMTQLTHRAGAAWYLAHLIERVTCRDLMAPGRLSSAADRGKDRPPCRRIDTALSNPTACQTRRWPTPILFGRNKEST